MTSAKHDVTVTTKVKDLASKELRQMGDTGHKAGKNIAAGFAVAVVGIGALKVAVRGAVNFVKGLTLDIAEQGDVIAKTSKRLGIATEALSALAHAGDLSGVSLGSLTNGLKLLAKNAYDASKGTGEAKDVLADLGVVVTKSDGSLRNLEDLLLDISDRMAGMSDATQRAAFAQRIFGRSGTDMIPLLLEGKAGIRGMMEEAEKLGIVWDSLAAKEAEEFNDALDKMEKSFKGVKMTVAQELLPVLTELFDDITTWVTENKGEIVEWGSDALDAVRDVVNVYRDLRDVLGEIKDFFEGVDWDAPTMPKPQDMDEWRADLDARAAAADPLGAMSNAAAAADDGTAAGRAWLKHFALAVQFPEADPSFSLFDVLPSSPFDTSDPGAFPHSAPSTRSDPVTPGLGWSPSALGGETTNPFGGMADDWRDAFKGAAEEIDTFSEALEFAIDRSTNMKFVSVDLGRTLADTFIDGFSDSVLAIQDGTKSISEAVGDMASSILKSMERIALNKFAGELLGIAFDALGGLGSSSTAGARAVDAGKYNVLPNIPQAAEGGVVTRPTLLIAGEAGPEAIVPLNKSGLMGGGSITINMTVNAAPGMDAQEVADAAASSVLSRLGSSGGYRSQMRRRVGGGL